MVKIVRDEKKRVKKGSCYFIASDEKLMSDDDVTPNDIFKLGLEEHKKQHHPNLVIPNLKQFNEGILLGYKQDFSPFIIYGETDLHKTHPYIKKNILLKLKFGKNRLDIDTLNEKLQPFIQYAFENKSIYFYELVIEEFISGKKIEEIDFESFRNVDNFYVVSQNAFCDNLILQFQNNEKKLVLYPDKESETYKKNEEIRELNQQQAQHLGVSQREDDLEKLKWIGDKRAKEDNLAWEKHKGEKEKEIKVNPKLKKLTNEIDKLIAQGRKLKQGKGVKEIKEKIGKLFVQIKMLNPDYKIQF